MTPYFVYVDGASGLIAGEGTAEAWPQVHSLLRDALLDAELAAGRDGSSPRGVPGGSVASGNGNGRAGSSGAARSSRVDEELRAAGIGPAHSSLYGAGEPSDR
jgi:hypothetical protein